MSDTKDEDSNNWVYCDPNDLKVKPPFCELFQINPKLLGDVTEDMRLHGFKAAYPLVVWREGNVVVDGHTRRLAAIKAKIKDVPVCYEDFNSEDEAVVFAIKSQVKRRNLTEPELLRSIQELDRRRIQGGSRTGVKAKASRDAFGETDVIGKDSHKKSAAETGSILGISTSKVERARVALSDPVVKEKVLSGEKTINAGWREVSEKKRERKKTEPKKKKINGNGKPNLSDYPMPKPSVPPPPILVLERTEEDEEYLQSFPLRSKVHTGRFDDDALLYREFKDFLKGLKSRLAEIVGPRSPAGRSLLHSELHSLATVWSVEEWILCPKCDGKGDCKKCNSGGYVIH